MIRATSNHLILGAFFLLLSSPSFSSDFVLGISAHLYAKNRQEITQSLDKIKALGFESVRIDAPWKVVETKVGKWLC